MTQRDRILKEIKDRGQKGLNSYFATFALGIKQAPTRVRELKDAGYKFKTIGNPDRSVNWILENYIAPENYDYIPYTDEDGYQVMRRVLRKPVQEALL